MNIDDILDAARSGAIIINNLTINNIDASGGGDVYTGLVVQHHHEPREPRRALPGSGVGWEVCARLDESLKGHTLDWRMDDIEQAHNEYIQQQKR